jgi:hypothetical protein
LVLILAKENTMTTPKTGAPTQCDAGCLAFDGGEKNHTKTCPFYAESRTKMYDDAIDALDAREATIAALVEALDDITRRAEFARSYQDDKFNFGWLTRNARAAAAKARAP